MAKYRLKPGVLDAWQMPQGHEFEAPGWLSAAFRAGTAYWQGGDRLKITCTTADGRGAVATAGDWILHIEGALTVMPARVFERLYELETSAGGDGPAN